MSLEFPDLTIITSNKTGVETGILKGSLFVASKVTGCTSTPDEVSEFFKLTLYSRLYEATQQNLEDAEAVIYIGPAGRSFKSLNKRAKTTPFHHVNLKQLDTLTDVFNNVLSQHTRVYITGVREGQSKGISFIVEEALKEARRI